MDSNRSPCQQPGAELEFRILCFQPLGLHCVCTMASGRSRGLETLLTPLVPSPYTCRPGLCLQPHCVSDHIGSRPAYLQRCANVPCPALPCPALPRNCGALLSATLSGTPGLPGLGVLRSLCLSECTHRLRACDPRTLQAAAGGWLQTHGHPDLHNGRQANQGPRTRLS